MLENLTDQVRIFVANMTVMATMANSGAEDLSNWSNQPSGDKEQEHISDEHLSPATQELPNHPGSRFKDHSKSQVSLIPLGERHLLGTISTR